MTKTTISRTREWIQAILLVLLGFFFLDISITGRLYYYINERFGWLVWFAAVLFLVLGILNIYTLFASRKTGTADEHHAHEHHDHHDHSEHEHEHHYEHHTHDHGHAAPSWPVLGIIAFPLVLGLLIPAKPLSSAAIGSSGVSTSFAAIQSGSVQLNIAPTDRNVLDWVRAFNSADNVDEFSGQPADVVGFVYRDIRFKDKPLFMVARFTVSCCTADANAIGVTVQADNADAFAQDSWVRVKGKFSLQELDGKKMPVLIAESTVPTDIPPHPYLYP